MTWRTMNKYQYVLVKAANVVLQRNFEKLREEERCHQFLMGLDDVLYGTVRSNLFATDLLPSLNKRYSILVQEERMRNVIRGKEERTEVIALVVQTGSRMKGREIKNKSVCTNCNRSGHDEAGCFLLIGYPDWWGERPKSDDKASGRGRGQNRSGSSSGRAQKSVVRAHAVQSL